MTLTWLENLREASAWAEDNPSHVTSRQNSHSATLQQKQKPEAMPTTALWLRCYMLNVLCCITKSESLWPYGMVHRPDLPQCVISRAWPRHSAAGDGTTSLPPVPHLVFELSRQLSHRHEVEPRKRFASRHVPSLSVSVCFRRTLHGTPKMQHARLQNSTLSLRCLRLRVEVEAPKSRLHKSGSVGPSLLQVRRQQ